MTRYKCTSHCQTLPASLLAVAILLQSILVVCGQNTGTAVQLDNVDIVESVEASNKARIEAELQHEEEARKHAQNVVRLAATDQLNSEIITNRTRAYLSCESGEMIVKINFTEPFRGVGYSDYDRSSPCKFYGDGSKYYELRLPLKGCGTKQEAPRIFINNIILRFHRSLELEEDEIKTIICRYPPPLAPPPPLIAAPILEQPPVNAPFMPAHLSEVELILIVSALLFLTLLLLGIGMGYYCLKRRNIKVVRKVPPPYIPPIPRASLSSSETYYESDYDDMYRTDHNLIEEDYTVARQNVIAPPLPHFESQMLDDRYVTNASHTDIDEDVEIGRWFAPKKPKITTLITDQYYVTPTHTTEIIDEITTHRLFVPPEKPLATRRIEETFVTPMETTEIEENVTQQRAFGPQVPVLTTHVTDDLFIHPEEDTEVIEEHTTHRLYRPKQPNLQVETVDDYFLHPEEETDFMEEIVDQRIVAPHPPPQPLTKTEEDYFRDVYEIDEMVDVSGTDRLYGPQPTTRTVQTSDDEYVTHSQVDEFIDDSSRRLMLPPRQPKITVKTVDDHYVTNIEETETTEKVIRTGRSMPNLLLTIDTEDEEEEDTRKATTISRTGFDITMRSIPHRPPPGPRTTTTITDTTLSSKITKEDIKFEQVLRVIDHPPPDHRIDNFDELFPPPKREKLRTVIMTDEVFRTIIIESTTVEEYSERIIRHPTYGPLFEPPTWEVIFRLLSLPEVVDIDRVEPRRKPPLGSIRAYVAGFSAHEVRSVTEEDVNFSRRRVTSAHFVPPPDYPTDDDPLSRPSGPHWASNLPDPKRYEIPPRDYSPLTPAFATTGRRPRQRAPIDSDLPAGTSSVFGARHLANPYHPYGGASPSIRRRLLEYGGGRPYSPDLDALSLEPASGSRAQAYLSYSASVAQSQQSRQSERQTLRATDEHEEIKSTTETDVYDWKRYS